MKKALWKRFLPFFLSLVMLFSVFAAAIPASAFEISSQPIEGGAEEGEIGEEFYYRIVVEDGMLRIQLNPQKVYEMLKDRSISREELLNFVPEDVLETLEKGRELSLDDLKALVSNYISPADLKQLKQWIPTEVIKEYFDLSMLEGILTVDEILSVIPIDEILADVDEDAIAALITPKVLELLLENEQAVDAVLNGSFVEALLEKEGFIDDILKVEGLQAELAALVKEGVVDKILADYPDLDEAILGQIDESALFRSDDAKNALKQYFSQEDKKQLIFNFVTAPAVIDVLKDFSEVHDTVLTQDVINKLLDEKVISKENIRGENGIFTDAQLRPLITDSVIEELLSLPSFANNVIENETLIKKIATNELLKELLDQGILDGRIEPADVFPATVDWALFAQKFSITAEDFADKFSLTPEYIYQTYGDDVTVDEIIRGENIASADILAKYPSITVDALIENDFVEIDALYDAEVLRDILAHDLKGREIIAKSINANPQLNLNDYWPYVDFVQLSHAIGTENLLEAIDSDPTIYPKLVHVVTSSGKLSSILSEDLCFEVFQNHTDIIFEKFSVSDLCEDYGFNKEEIVNAVVAEFGGYFGFMQKWNISTDFVVGKIGGYGTLLNQYLNASEVADTILKNEKATDVLLSYVNFNDVIASVGGYADFFALYSTKEKQAIFQVIGTDNLQTFLTDSGLLETVEFKKIASDLWALIKSKEPEYRALLGEIANRLITILNVEVSSIYLNDTKIYRPGRFDFEAIAVGILQAIPDVDDFLAMQEGDPLSQFVLSATIREKTYSLGISVEFIGDFSKLQELMAEELFLFDVSDELDISVSTVLPSVTTRIYEKLLASDRIPVALKKEILLAPGYSLDHISELLADVSDENLQKIVDEISEKTDEIREKIYRELDQRFGENAAKLDAAKRKADAVLEKFQSLASIKKARDLAVKVLNRVPDGAANKTLSDLYEGNSLFHLNGSFSENFYGRATALLEKTKLPENAVENILLYFGNDMTLDGSLDLKVTATNVYQLLVEDGQGEIQCFYLPAGFLLENLNEIIPSLNADFEEGAKMPPADTTIASEELWYSVEFYLNGTLVGTVSYLKGTTSLDPASLPVIPDKVGYITPTWPEIVLGQEEITRVYATYTPKPHSTTIVHKELNIDFELHYDVEDRELSLPIPSLHGHTFHTWYIDTNKNGVIDEEDIRLERIPEMRTFRMLRTTVTLPEGRFALPDGYTLPAEDDLAMIPEMSITEHKITFKDWNGNTIDTTEEITYNVFESREAIEARFPTLTRDHYTLAWYVGETAWDSFDFYAADEDLVITSVATPIEYTVSFRDSADTEIGTDSYTVENQTITEPSVPAIAGYSGEWYVVAVDGTPITAELLSSYKITHGNLTVKAIYSPIRFEIVFHGDSDITLYFNIKHQKLVDKDGKDAAVPTVPVKVGYTESWSAYDLSDPKDQDVYPEYEPITYTITFHDGSNVTELLFNIKDQKLVDKNGNDATVPTISDKVGYTNPRWGSYDLSLAKSQEIYPEYDPILYTITFRNGSNVTELFFNIRDQKLIDKNGADAAVPSITEKDGYTAVWENYDLSLAENQEVDAVYSPITYPVYFSAGNSVVHTDSYTVETPLTSFPNVPDRTAEGYGNGIWYVVKVDGKAITPTKLSEFTFTYGEVEIEARYTPIEYTAYFRVDGNVVGSVKFTVEDKELREIPDLPAKLGYSAKWSDYEISAQDLYIDAVYTLIKYTATFKDEAGDTVATIDFTINDKTITNAPSVPKKAGHRGEWYVTAENGTAIEPVLLSEYTLTDASITVEAVYTVLTGDEDTDETTSVPKGDKDAGGMSWLWWIVLIILLILIILAILWFLKKKNLPPFKSKETPPAIVAAAIPEEEEEEEVEEAAPITIVESIDVQTADEAMTDEVALTVVETVEVADKAQGQRAIVNIHAINDAFNADETVDLAALKAKKLIPAKAERVKVLADGTLDKPLTVIADAFSVQAIKMITLTGGHAIQKKYKL